MEKYEKLTLSFVKRQYYPFLCLALLFVAVSDGFISFKGLESAQAAKVMEMYAAFVGILLLTPLFMPEQDKEIWDLERSKALDMWKVYLPRLILALTGCLFTVSLFVWRIRSGGGAFEADILFRGACCEILFLGSIGFFASAVTNQVVLGYMAAVVYFVMNLSGGKYLGKLALFQMMRGEYGTWVYWLAGAVVLLAAGIAVRENAVRR